MKKDLDGPNIVPIIGSCDFLYVDREVALFLFTLIPAFFFGECFPQYILTTFSTDLVRLGLCPFGRMVVQV